MKPLSPGRALIGLALWLLMTAVVAVAVVLSIAFVTWTPPNLALSSWSPSTRALLFPNALLCGLLILKVLRKPPETLT